MTLGIGLPRNLPDPVNEIAGFQVTATGAMHQQSRTLTSAFRPAASSPKSFYHTSFDVVEPYDHAALKGFQECLPNGRQLHQDRLLGLQGALGALRFISFSGSKKPFGSPCWEEAAQKLARNVLGVDRSPLYRNPKTSPIDTSYCPPMSPNRVQCTLRVGLLNSGLLTTL